ncbi:MAG: STAS domain-containing protein [Lachnospiraceae bacterium]|nr:STAS domain-containing protein [Lachnospiraceae bacterium]
MNIQLFEKTNPTYKYACQYLNHLSMAGIENASDILSGIKNNEPERSWDDDLSKELTSLEKNCLILADEARFLMTNEMIRGYESKNIIDLPCGYNPRSIYFTKEGYKYIGLDIPYIINSVSPVIKGFQTNYSHRINYCPIDVTNYKSINDSLTNVNGEITIVSEMLLSFLSENELKEVCDNIYKMLSFYGGCWIIMDIGCKDLYKNTFKAAGDNVSLSLFDNAISKLTPEIKLYQNSLYTNGTEGAANYFISKGFEIEKVSVSEIIPDVFPLLKSSQNIPGIEDALKEYYQQMDYWTITINKKRGTHIINTNSSECIIEQKTGNGFLYLSLSGRIDTITAPEMLLAFEKANENNTLKKITIDCKNLNYISSAGLRVLLIMVKKIGDKNGLTLKNVSSDIMEILSTTGFLDIIGNITCI